MGLSRDSVGIKTVDNGLVIKKRNDTDRVIALAGNPNVGKSTVFNELTGLAQHTGNWPGKTVTNAQGYCSYGGQGYVMVDIPGCYSLMAHSTEEEVARDFICFEHPDAVLVVCDATCLERNLNLVLQIMEASPKVAVCVNLMDEAKKKRISIRFDKLREQLGVPVFGTAARSGKGMEEIYKSLEALFQEQSSHPERICIYYPEYIESAIACLYGPVREAVLKLESGHDDEKSQENAVDRVPVRWLCARLLDANDNLLDSVKSYLGEDIMQDERIKQTLHDIQEELKERGISQKKVSDDMAAAFIRRAEEVCRDAVVYENQTYNSRDRRLDRLFTSRLTGFPIMFLMLLGIFWLTITGANYPSQLLNTGLFWLEDKIFAWVTAIGMPGFLCEMLVHGVYRVLAWVVSVMLPPMAIFFPLFTLLEDFGYLPRVAFNLDRCFKRCCACGKQALTIAMGFGCNAAGIVGCRIIDSPRERLIATITNNFVPCNGRLPMMISLISMFFIGSAAGMFSSVLSAAILAGIIVLGIVITLVVSKLLSMTILKGIPSSFTLELPPYRRPQVGKVIVRSIVDRTLFVLGRAVAVAAPAGLIIWLMANVQVGDMTLLSHLAAALDPFGRLIGMDGVILLAFILGFPANEVVVPIMIMAYMAQGSLSDIHDLSVLRDLFIANGWTWVTAVCTILFSLMHWPCSTTCLTIHKETQSLKWTLLSWVVPTITGVLICFLVNMAAKLFL